MVPNHPFAACTRQPRWKNIAVETALRKIGTGGTCQDPNHANPEAEPYLRQQQYTV